jgi:hypothetical protein
MPNHGQISHVHTHLDQYPWHISRITALPLATGSPLTLQHTKGLFRARLGSMQVNNSHLMQYFFVQNMQHACTIHVVQSAPGTRISM